MPLDSLHSVLFYVLAAVTVAGALTVALLRTRAARGYGLLAVGARLGGLLAVLSAGFAAVIVLACFIACGLALAGTGYRVVWAEPSGRWEQAGAVACGLLFAILLYATWRADFFAGAYPGGAFGATAVGRLL